MSWIDVAVAKPPNAPFLATFCLVTGQDVSEFRTGPEIAVWRWDGGMWWSEDGTEIPFAHQVVTHWMPLPAVDDPRWRADPPPENETVLIGGHHVSNHVDGPEVAVFQFCDNWSNMGHPCWMPVPELPC